MATDVATDGVTDVTDVAADGVTDVTDVADVAADGGTDVADGVTDVPQMFVSFKPKNSRLTLWVFLVRLIKSN